MTAPRVAIYTRISADREGEALGVARQEEDCRALAGRLGAKSVVLFEENDVSASTRSRKKRVKYPAMLDRARAGEFDLIVAYSNSRLTRRPSELEELIQLYVDHGIVCHTVVSGSYNLATADGRMQARMLAAIDAAEAERTAERVSRAAKQAAEQGKWHGGPRPFGYEADGVTVREPEAEAIREAAAAVLAGASLGSIVRGWNEAGWRTGRSDRPWTLAGVRDLLRNPRYAGRRRYRDTVVADAAWPAVLDADTFDTVAAILNDPARRHGPKAAKRLLTGIATCGVCGATVHGSGGTASAPAYRCSGSTGHFARQAAPIDGYVVEVVLSRLEQPDARAALSARQSEAAGNGEAAAARAAIRADEARLEALAVGFADGDLTAAQVKTATARLRSRIETNTAVLASSGGDSGALAGILGAGDVRAAWTGATGEQRRRIIAALVTVVVHPTGRGARTFDPGTVEITWRT